LIDSRAPQSERSLQLERQPSMRVGDLRQIARGQFACFADVGHVLPIGDAVGLIAPCNDVLLVDFLGPPSKLCHAIFYGAGCQTLQLPTLDQCFYVLGFEALRSQMPEPHLLELVRHLVENPFAVALRGAAAVAIAPA